MRNYLLFILLIIICIKIFTNNYEYMSNNDKIANLIGIGFTSEVAEKILDDTSTICAIPTETSTGGIGLLKELNTEEKNELIFKDYKLKIKSGEQFHKKLNDLEQEVFIRFYGPDEKKWKPEYEKWKLKRNKTIDNKLAAKCRYILNSRSSTNLAELKEELNDKIKTLSYLEKINKDGYSADYLSGSKNIDASLSIRKMQYRTIEEDTIQLYNNYINWIYYLIFITLLLLLYSQSKLNIIKNFMIYIFLLLLPVILYPYMFKIGKYLMDYIYTNSKNVVPQNAFMND